MVINTART